VVGVLWSTKVDYTTFFGSNVEYIHGIQKIPFTPISEFLLDAPWITDSYPVEQNAIVNASQGWLGFIYMSHAVIDSTTAWSEVNTLTGYDDGNTKTNTLFWVATRSGTPNPVYLNTGTSVHSSTPSVHSTHNSTASLSVIPSYLFTVVICIISIMLFH